MVITTQLANRDLKLKFISIRRAKDRQKRKRFKNTRRFKYRVSIENSCIYMNTYIFYIYFILFIQLSNTYLIFNLVFLTFSLADTHEVAK